ncbi:hypothetical protein MOV66_02405 [Agrobacterium sp. SHOUNA12C]|nr:hypothetical protein [Agrobacterium sp. BETTINA12B]MCJ9755484.1 hypothetical protein [Agrobacterium sp. SHOUNA12C]NTG34808.1 hypothetical protein [Rhizobium rhizogenes]NTG54057.1 hypothetical protein [Rhizobium rhizogenes]
MQDMTMSEVLKDPLVRQMLRADKVSLGTFAKLLENAANERGRNLAARSWAVCALSTVSAGKEYHSVA